MKAVIDTCLLSEVKVGDPARYMLRQVLVLHQFLPSILTWVWSLQLTLRSTRNGLDCYLNTSMDLSLVSKIEVLESCLFRVLLVGLWGIGS